MYLVVNLHKSDGEGATGEAPVVEGAAVVGAWLRQGARWWQGGGGKAARRTLKAAGRTLSARSGGKARWCRASACFCEA